MLLHFLHVGHPWPSKKKRRAEARRQVIKL